MTASAMSRIPRERFPMIPHFPKIRMTALALGLAMAAAAQEKSYLLSDFESGAGQNSLSGFWFYFTDIGNEGNSRITTADTVTGYWDSTSVGEGFGGSTFSGRMGFQFGDKRPTCGATCTFDPEVTLATDLRSGDSVQNLTGATHVNFAAKAKTPVKVTFLVLTAGIKDFSHYRQVIDIGTEWKEYSVVLKSSPTFAQPSWGVRVPFDPSQVTHFHWQVSQGLNTGMTGDSLLIDDVKILGWEPIIVTKVAPSVAASRVSGRPSLGFGENLHLSLADVPGNRGGTVRIRDLAGRSLLQAAYQPGQKDLDLHVVQSDRTAFPYVIQILPKQ